MINVIFNNYFVYEYKTFNYSFFSSYEEIKLILNYFKLASKCLNIKKIFLKEQLNLKTFKRFFLMKENELEMDYFK